MVVWEHDAESGEKIILLRPNGSLSRRQGYVLLAVLGLVMGGIGFVCALIGAWLVVPFSGLEFILLAFCLRFSQRKSAEREIITITDAKLKVEQGRERCVRCYEFQWAWVRMNWIKSASIGRPSQLRLGLHGKDVEIGRFLVESERQALAGELKGLLNSRKFNQ